MKKPRNDPSENTGLTTRRAVIMGGAQMAVMGVLGLRMRELQVKQADQYRLLAEENRINIRLLPPARGQIFDRTGFPIAVNEPNYRITIVREDAGDIDEVLYRLSRIVSLSPEKIDETKAELKRRSPFVPVTILDRLSWDDVAEVSCKRARFAWCYCGFRPFTCIPYGGRFCPCDWLRWSCVGL
jgi:penicillin-binding protein 2